ncbi:hypothetical protein GpSGHVEth131 [Glossina pallidipes salivary gland hypertrophy virus]|uniref:Uncharacterized protein n=2 Tax=Glossina hytrovirus (isolate Glossina pallidipes/Ethiopia/Seibersdorf/-) TaxID=379529 RepID=A0A0Y0JI30_GHVS|nr:hypothetical protein SGHV119 [Glossina pallidipes salivary gland hypertrophy virus]ABQ08892.1 hypothetical protein SGHV119 [Glossina pallidipes salivary gland hypertrophy virus]AMB48735.1 hypothetical protein GpSGHVEth131 [Glossina pallidipes salivary gland hypertrophy virus]
MELTLAFKAFQSCGKLQLKTLLAFDVVYFQFIGKHILDKIAKPLTIYEFGLVINYPIDLNWKKCSIVIRHADILNYLHNGYVFDKVTEINIYKIINYNKYILVDLYKLFPNLKFLTLRYKSVLCFNDLNNLPKLIYLTLDSLFFNNYHFDNSVLTNVFFIQIYLRKTRQLQDIIPIINKCINCKHLHLKVSSKIPTGVLAAYKENISPNITIEQHLI